MVDEKREAGLKAFEFLELAEPIQVMDVGASAIAELPIYKPLLDGGLAHLNAFEGDERQNAGIRDAYGEHATIYKDFLFDGSVQTLYLASAASGMTSHCATSTASRTSAISKGLSRSRPDAWTMSRDCR